MNIKLKYIVIFILIISFIIGGLIYHISKLNSVIRVKEESILVLQQNELSLKDKLIMKADSIQDFAIQVENLKNKNSDFNKKYNILISKYEILIDSINILNSPAHSDTTGNKIIISFDGKKGKIWYKGYTTYFKIDGNSIYSIDVGIDAIKIESLLYFDIENKIVRNKIYADGVLIDSAKTVIDSTIYLLVQGYMKEPIYEQDFFDRLKAILELNQSIFKDNLVYKSDKIQLNIGAEYNFNLFKIYGKKDLLNPYIEFGISFNPSLKQTWNTIF